MSKTHAALPDRGLQKAQARAPLRSEIAFIDPGVSDIPTLLAGMRPEVEPILLDKNSPALAQIAAELRGRSALEAVHIIAHGAPGEESLSRPPRISIQRRQ